VKSVMDHLLAGAQAAATTGEGPRCPDCRVDTCILGRFVREYDARDESQRLVPCAACDAKRLRLPIEPMLGDSCRFGSLPPVRGFDDRRTIPCRHQARERGSGRLPV
jgi:hypothetical protein